MTNSLNTTSNLSLNCYCRKVIHICESDSIQAVEISIGKKKSLSLSLSQKKKKNGDLDSKNGW